MPSGPLIPPIFLASPNSNVSSVKVVRCQFETAYQLVLQSFQSRSIKIWQPHLASLTLTSPSPLAAPANTLVSLCLLLTKATVLAQSSSHFIFSSGYLRYCEVYIHESGRCRTLPLFLTFFYYFTFPGFPFILTCYESVWVDHGWKDFWNNYQLR